MRAAARWRTLVKARLAEMEHLQASGQWDRAGELLAVEAARLETAGADMLVLCTNTMHKVADAVEKEIDAATLRANLEGSYGPIVESASV